MSRSVPLPKSALWPIVGLITVALLMPLSAASAPSPGFSSPNPANPAQSWAWGAVFGKTDQGSFSGTTQAGVPWSFSYTLHAFLAWNVIVTQTNLSSTAFELSGSRVVVGSYFLSAQGSQGATQAQLNVTVQGWEHDSEFANFTTTGSVLLNGTTQVPAVAIENSHGTVAGNLTATESASLAGGQTASLDGYASGAVNADATLSFSPALGLMPTTPVPGGQWNSSSAYTAQGTYSNACHWAFDGTSALGSKSSGSGTCGGSGTLSASGTVWLAGADEGDDYLAGFGHFRSVGLELPSDFEFHLHDGLFLVPASVDLLSGGSGALGGTNAANSDGTDASTAYVDLNPHAGHVGVVAANTRFGPAAGVTSSLPFAMSAAGASSSGGISALASGPDSQFPAATNPLPSYGIQGYPESVAQAQSSNGCLLNPGTCLTSTSGHSGLLFLVLVVAVVAVAVAVLVARRSGGSKPSSPGTRYIPAAANPSYPATGAPGAGGVAGTPKGTRPQPSQDPLGHLW